jgi:hypothetical protein
MDPKAPASLRKKLFKTQRASSRTDAAMVVRARRGTIGAVRNISGFGEGAEGDG